MTTLGEFSNNGPLGGDFPLALGVCALMHDMSRLDYVGEVSPVFPFSYCFENGKFSLTCFYVVSVTFWDTQL